MPNWLLRGSAARLLICLGGLWLATPLPAAQQADTPAAPETDAEPEPAARQAADTGVGPDAGTAAEDAAEPAGDEADRKLADCILRALDNAPDNISAAQLRDWCLENNGGHQRRRNEAALRTRLALEESNYFNPFVITPHRRNYIMPVSYWSNRHWNDPAKEDDDLQSIEAKFQLSIKAPLMTGILDHYNLYFAYTATSFFQVYNEKQSRPFRETNYMPELFVTREVDWQFGPIDSELLSFGYLHQSNGRDVPTSRSWERLFVSYVFRTGQYYWSIKPWWRIPESDRDDPEDPRRDDNPDIERYMGPGELRLARPFGNHVAELMLRNNLRTGKNRGAVQLDYTFPLTRRFKGIFQVSNGYGDSLINYNDNQTRVSIGILLTDTL